MQAVIIEAIVVWRLSMSTAAVNAAALTAPVGFQPGGHAGVRAPLGGPLTARHPPPVVADSPPHGRQKCDLLNMQSQLHQM